MTNENVKTGQEVVKASSYVPQLVLKLKQDFEKANEGMGLDFVRMSTWLTFNSKGQFVEKDNEDVNYGDNVDVVIAQGEERFSLWGKEGTEEGGEMIVSAKTREEAETLFNDWIDANPSKGDSYSVTDIQSRYIAYVVPVISLSEDTPKIYIMGFSPTTKIAYGTWAFNVFNGKFKGIPKNTPINTVVTKITTVSKTNKDKKNYIVLDFKAVELFSPDKYLKK
jgi:hypothetical protein